MSAFCRDTVDATVDDVVKFKDMAVSLGENIGGNMTLVEIKVASCKRKITVAIAQFTLD